MHDPDAQSTAPTNEELASQKKPTVNQRSDRSSALKGNTARTPQEPRRRRGGDPRSTSWGDQLLHSLCAHALHELPLTFPVEHHRGAATIARAIVARRDDEVLFCTYSHCGPHAWPDGEEVSEAQSVAAP